MPRLSKKHQAYIVQLLACFRSPSEVAEAVKAEFDIEVERTHIQFYDPTKGPADKRLPEKWRQLFEATRTAYLERVADVGVSHLVYRLEELQDALGRAKRTKNDDLLLRILRQAAEDTGGVYTNKKEISGPKGSPIPVSFVNALDKAYGGGSTSKQ